MSTQNRFDVKKKVKTQRFTLKRFLLNASIGGYKAGSTISLECDKKSGDPKKKYWRRRLREAKVDGCMELVVDKKVKTKPTSN